MPGCVPFTRPNSRWRTSCVFTCWTAVEDPVGKTVLSFLIGLGLLVDLGLVASPAWAADLRGRVTQQGKPVANEPIKIGDKEVGRTDVAGVYWLNLPAGTHTLSVKGQAVQVQVSPNGSRRDIQLP